MSRHLPYSDYDRFLVVDDTDDNDMAEILTVLCERSPDAFNRDRQLRSELSFG